MSVLLFRREKKIEPKKSREEKNGKGREIDGKTYFVEEQKRYSEKIKQEQEGNGCEREREREREDYEQVVMNCFFGQRIVTNRFRKLF